MRKVLAGKHDENPDVTIAPMGSGRPVAAAPPRPPKGPAMHGGAGALLRRTGASRASPTAPRGFGRVAGTVVRPGTACVRPIAGEDGSPGGLPSAVVRLRPAKVPELPGRPVPYPVKLADPPRVVTSMAGRAELAAGGDRVPAEAPPLPLPRQAPES